jgi:hypothetical protein
MKQARPPLHPLHDRPCIALLRSNKPLSSSSFAVSTTCLNTCFLPVVRVAYSCIPFITDIPLIDTELEQSETIADEDILLPGCLCKEGVDDV